jgi:hypothetical protein
MFLKIFLKYKNKRIKKKKRLEILTRDRIRPDWQI